MIVTEKFGWLEFRECGELFGKRFHLKDTVSKKQRKIARKLT